MKGSAGGKVEGVLEQGTEPCEAFAGWRSYVVHLMRCCCQTIITLIISSAVVTLGAHS